MYCFEPHALASLGLLLFRSSLYNLTFEGLYPEKDDLRILNAQGKTGSLQYLNHHVLGHVAQLGNREQVLVLCLASAISVVWVQALTTPDARIKPLQRLPQPLPEPVSPPIELVFLSIWFFS